MRQLPSADPAPLSVQPGAHNAYYGQPYAAEPETPSGPPSGGLLEYWRIIQRHKATLVVVAFLGGLLGFLYTFPQTPVFQARTMLEVQTVNADFLNMRNVNPTSEASSWYSDSDMPTHVRILQSQSFINRVVNKLELTKRPLMINESRLEAWKRALGLPVDKPAYLQQRALGMAGGSMKVRVQNNTRILEVSCDSTDPQLAADFANTVAQEFIEQNLEARWKTTQHTGEWLTRQMEDLKIKLEKSEEAMQNYARITGLLFTGEKENLAEQRLKQLQEELSKAQADRIAKQSRFELASHAAADTLPDIIDDPSLRDYKTRIADLERQKAELSSSLTPAHPKVKKVDAQIQVLRGALGEESGNIVRRIKNEYEAAERREKLLSSDYTSQATLMSEQADKVTHYNILKREVDTNRQLYDSILQRVKEASVASALRASNIRVIDPATRPGGPYKPNPSSNAMMGTFVGFLLGLAFVVLRDRADRTIQEPGDASFYLGCPELGLIPSAGADPYRKRNLLSLPAPEGQAEPLELVTWQRRPSAMAESFRATLTSLLFASGRNERPRVILLSSPAPKEGKTTVCTNLAVALAEINERVLLIDADLRKPRLHNIFDLPNEQGLAELLRRKEPVAGPLNGLARATEVPNLSVITSGHSKEADTALLYSARLGEIIRAVRAEYDTVLIDTPPMLTMADARVIGRHVDGVILVARVSVTTRDSLQSACRRFVEDGTPVLGTIVNDWNPRKSGRYGYYRYYERYKHYYAKDSGKDGE